jgi:hypothetical protein
MEILFKNDIIGKIENTYREEYWIHGKFFNAPPYFKYKDFLDAIVSEDGPDVTQFNTELLDENNWFVRSKDGLKGIWIPAIYSDDEEISIRYR